MAILNTPIQALPYPDVNSELRQGDEYVRNLALALEKKLFMVFSSATERDTSLPVGTKTEGMMCWLQDVNKIYLCDGALAWQQIYPAVPTITSGTTVPSGSLGAVGDIFIQY